MMRKPSMQENNHAVKQYSIRSQEKKKEGQESDSVYLFGTQRKSNKALSQKWNKSEMQLIYKTMDM